MQKVILSAIKIIADQKTPRDLATKAKYFTTTMYGVVKFIGVVF